MNLINKLISPFAESLQKSASQTLRFTAENIPHPNLFFLHNSSTGNSVARRMCYKNFTPYTCNKSRALRYSK